MIFRFAYEIFEHDLRESESADVIRKHDGYERTDRAAMETVDILLASKGEIILKGGPETHKKHEETVYKWGMLDRRRVQIGHDYFRYVQLLIVLGFYTQADPSRFDQLLRWSENSLTRSMP